MSNSQVLDFYMECMELCIDSVFVNAKSEHHTWTIAEAERFEKYIYQGLTPYGALVQFFGDPLPSITRA